MQIQEDKNHTLEYVAVFFKIRVYIQVSETDNEDDKKRPFFFPVNITDRFFIAKIG